MKIATLARATFALLAALAAVAALATGTAHADDAALAKEVEALRAACEAQQAQLEAQAKLLAAQQAQLEALTQKLAQSAPAAAAPKTNPAGDAPKVAFANSRLTITAADGRSSLAVRGFAQVDGAMYREDSEGPLTTDFRRGSVGATANRETNAARDFSEGFLLRRARFGVDGMVGQNFTYRLLFDFGGSGTEGVRVNDAWIAYTGLAPFTFQFGAFSPPANMDDSTSAEDLVFLERSSAGEISRALAAADARFGFGVKANGKRWMSSLALTSRTVGDPEVFDAQLAAVGRAGFLVATSDDYNVHVGASGTYVFAPPDLGSAATPPRHAIRFRDRPEIRVDGARLIDSGAIDAERVRVLAAEFGANWKNVYVQAEHYWFDVTRRAPTTLEDPSFKGYYLQGSWILTGESRRYNPVTGSFQNPRPTSPFVKEGGTGAWELAARYSRIDLSDPLARGDTASVASVGVNWLPIEYVKVMLEGLHITRDTGAEQNSVNAVQLRVQLYYAIP